MEDRQVDKNSSTRKRVSTIDMLPSEALTCAIEVEKEIAAAKDPKKMLAPAIKYFATDHYNWTAGVSLLQFSFILEQFIPRQWFVYNHRTMEDPIEERARVIVGSFGDGLSLSTFDFAVHDCLTNNVSLMSDVDQMVCHPDYVITKDASSLGVIETDDTHIGYARIRVTNPKYIRPDSDPSGCYFNSGATVILMTLNIGDILSGEDRACKHGPAVQDVISRAGERFNIDRDNVLSIPCNEWPKEAGRWATRERPSGWPDKDMIESIVGDGCHLVATSHPKSRRPDVEWRYSFSVAERTLARSLSDAQRQCYILLKLIVMRQLKPCSVVCSYHLKTIFLWQCEKIIPSKWSLGPGLAATFLCLLDELLYCLATHQLPHYFIPENNLLEHVDADFLVDAARSLSHLRRDPLQHVLAFNARYRFTRLTSTTRTFDLTRHFDDVIDDARVCHYNTQRRYKLQQQALWIGGLMCLREEMFADAPFVFTSLERVTSMLSGRSMGLLIYSSPILEGFAGVELDLSEATGLLGRVDRNDVYRNSYVAYFLSRHAVTKCKDLTPKDEVDYLTDLSFRGANRAALTMDYCMFLVYLRRHEEAMPLLYAIIKEECDHPVGYNVYSKSMSVIKGDSNLRQETDRHTLIRTMSVAFAYYTLVKIYCNRNEEAEVTPLLPDFQHLCSETLERSTVDSTMHAQAYSLLGYTYLAVWNYSQARQAFKRAAQLEHGYTLAEENRDMCGDLRQSVLSMCGTQRPVVASLSSQEPVSRTSSEGAAEAAIAERDNNEVVFAEALDRGEICRSGRKTTRTNGEALEGNSALELSKEIGHQQHKTTQETNRSIPDTPRKSEEADWSERETARKSEETDSSGRKAQRKCEETDSLGEETPKESGETDCLGRETQRKSEITVFQVTENVEARQAFKRATQLQHGYTLAEENRDMCDDLMCGTPRPIVASLSSQEPVSSTSSEGSDETDSSGRKAQRKSEITVFQVTENDDGSAGVSLLQLSFILDQVLPQRHIRRSLTDADRENIHAALSLKFDNLPEIKLEPSGSFYDGFHLPVFQQPSWTGSDYHARSLDSHFRLLAVHVNQAVVRTGDNTDDCLGVIEDDDTHPGYVRIQLVDPRTSSCKVPKADTGDFYLSTHVWEFEDRTFANLASDIANTRCEEPEENEQINSVHCESMSAIPSSQWPKEADRWITRDRPSGWPDENLVKTVIADGCHLVPMSHPRSRYPDVEWSYSFSVAERTLARSLSDAQRQCYILLKTIVMQQLSHCSALCLYHIKTVFLWQCEKIPASEWSTDTSLAANFLWLLDELLQCAATRDLPHYFIPEVNLFDHIHPDFLQVIADSLVLIRRRPIEQVLAFFKQFHFEFSMTSCDLADILSNVIDDAKQGHDNPPTRFANQRAVLLKMGRQFMREGKFDEALCVLTQYVQLGQKMYQFDRSGMVKRRRHFDSREHRHMVQKTWKCERKERDGVVRKDCYFGGGDLNYKSPCRLMTDICEELSVQEGLPGLDYITRAFPDDPNRGRLLAYLAMFFHMDAFAPGNEQWQQELLKRAEENYLEAIKCGGGGNIQIMMNYALFLVHLHRGDEAIPTLKEIIAREDDLPVELSGYSEGAIMFIADKNLLNEIVRHGTITASTVAIAYYVLASIYCDTDREIEGVILLPAFNRFCSKPLMERELDPTNLSRTLSLLGYTYQAMRKYTEAGQAFRRAAELEAGYTAAEENRDLCDARVLSLQQCSDD